MANGLSATSGFAQGFASVFAPMMIEAKREQKKKEREEERVRKLTDLKLLSEGAIQGPGLPTPQQAAAELSVRTGREVRYKRNTKPLLDAYGVPPDDTLREMADKLPEQILYNLLSQNYTLYKTKKVSRDLAKSDLVKDTPFENNPEDIYLSFQVADKLGMGAIKGIPGLDWLYGEEANPMEVIDDTFYDETGVLKDLSQFTVKDFAKLHLIGISKKDVQNFQDKSDENTPAALMFKLRWGIAEQSNFIDSYTMNSLMALVAQAESPEQRQTAIANLRKFQEQLTIKQMQLVDYVRGGKLLPYQQNVYDALIAIEANALSPADLHDLIEKYREDGITGFVNLTDEDIIDIEREIRKLNK